MCCSGIAAPVTPTAALEAPCEASTTSTAPPLAGRGGERDGGNCPLEVRADSR
eukprot:CAMPEP_0180658986 /NCGR_PEP_ID=MMETSP1037_2-20121125/57321_1 /TAXON_ID=632150 /ORGANISM="Azadinium spinosum, Strain 3D9" /LENGTH=52 /DNA_ID=CAMNT_0022685959 /DNA_START=120 /DNA_END=274 /DNA_ORIENTATION=-